MAESKSRFREGQPDMLKVGQSLETIVHSIGSILCVEM